jgi:hypothetical protein
MIEKIMGVMDIIAGILILFSNFGTLSIIFSILIIVKGLFSLI